jgi:hypothetical protein
MIRRLVPLLLLTVLAACASREAEMAETAQKSLIGLTEDQVLACAGQPDQRLMEGGTRLLVYPRETTRQLTVDTPARPNPTGMAQPQPTYEYYRSCETTFALRGGRVSQVRMRGRTETGRPNLDACGVTVSRCLRLVGG